MATQNPRAYYGISVTVPASTVSKLLDLLKAVDPEAPGSCRALEIQNDPDSGDYLLIGDSNVDIGPPQRCGFKLGGGESFSYGEGLGSDAVPLANIYLFSETELIANVQIQTF